MARSKFSKMLEKINNNEGTINSKEVEENDMTINPNVNIEDDNDITEEEMEEYIEDCNTEFLGDNEDAYPNEDNEDDIDSDESDEIDNEYDEKYNEANDTDDNDSPVLNDNELNDDAEPTNSSEESNSKTESENKSEDEADDALKSKSKNNLKDKSKNKPENKTKKNSILYDMLSRPEGATLDELEIELGSKRPSIRGVMSNMQKELEFCLLTIDVSKPSFDKEDGSKTFKKETRYFIKDCEFDLNDTIIALFKIDSAFSKKDNNEDDNNL